MPLMGGSAMFLSIRAYYKLYRLLRLSIEGLTPNYVEKTWVPGLTRIVTMDVLNRLIAKTKLSIAESKTKNLKLIATAHLKAIEDFALHLIMRVISDDWDFGCNGTRFEIQNLPAELQEMFVWQGHPTFSAWQTQARLEMLRRKISNPFKAAFEKVYKE